MKILGIHDGHNASACLMADGQIKYLVQEERVSGEKNKSGFPYLSINLILKESGLSFEDIDLIGMNGSYMPAPSNRQETLDYYSSLLKNRYFINPGIIKNRLKGVSFIAGPYERKNRQKLLSSSDIITL